MNTKNNNIFFLGGYDLEMSCIEELLKCYSIKYFSKNLVWNNAFVEKYSSEMEQYSDIEGCTMYGIELIGDPKINNYIAIDHHNELQNKPSSLEQVAKILGVELSREQELVALNDKGYIPAMIEFGASDQEIASIRLRDRRFQGVTQQDELLAEESIVNNLTQINGVTIVKSLTDKFSPICDRLFPNHSLLIYTNQTFTYYGVLKNKILNECNRLCFDKSIFYYGGGDSGFIGVKGGAISEQQIKELINRITTL